MSVKTATTETAIGVALCGYGAAAAAHAATLRRLPGVRLHSVSGPDADRARQFASRWSVPVVLTSSESAARSIDIDAVVVATPDNSHLPIVMAALGAGKHVYCEKPLGMNSAECSQMADAAVSSGVINMVGFSNRRFPWVRAAKALIDEGTLGIPRYVHIQSFGARLARGPAANDWRSDPRRSNAGVLGDLGSHAFDLVRHLVGEVLEVCADLSHVHVPLTSNDDAIVLVRTATGVHGSVAVSWLSTVDQNVGPGRRHVQIAGSRGSVLLENGRALFFPLEGEVRTIEGAAGPFTAYDDYLATALGPSVAAFIAGVRSGTSVEPDFADGVQCQRIVEASLQSAEKHEWMTVAREGSRGNPA